MPQCLDFLEGGSLRSAGVVLVAVEPVAVVLELVVSVNGSGTQGLGQVMSFASSGQNSLILWKRYHWRAGDSPEGVRCSGRTVAVDDHSCFSRLKSISGASDFSRAKTCPLLVDENRR